MRLHRIVRGRGYPILCLHGHPGSSDCMNVFIDSLSEHFMTIAPDLRGYGQSRALQPFAMEDHVHDLHHLLDELAIQECLILGWSLGGILAMELAIRYPERVSGLVLLATAARPIGNHPPISWQDNGFTAIASLINRVVPGWQWNINTFGKRSLYRYLIQQHTPAAYQRLADEAFPAFLQTSKFAQQALTTALQQKYNRLQDLQTLEIPALVLCGAGDRHITERSSQETADFLPQSTFKVYPNTAHLFPWEISAEVLADIRQWLWQEFSHLMEQPQS